MVKSNVKSLLIILLLTVIIIASFQISVFAASDDGLSLLLDENSTNGNSTLGTTPGNNTNDSGLLSGNNELLVGNSIAGNNTTGQNVQGNNTVPPVLNNTVGNNVPTLNNTYGNQDTLPKTGENDIYIVTVLIAIFVVVTIYAYKKINDYNGL